MRQLTILILIITVFSCSNKTAHQTIDTEAVTKFWEITEILKEDSVLTDSLWLSYYTLVGNKRYMEYNRSEQNVADHRKFLALFFRPSLSDSLQLTLESGESENNDIFQNLRFIKDNENELKEYTNIITSPQYFQDCIGLAKEYLPKGEYESIPNELKTYLQTFTYDAAIQGNYMYYGLTVVYDFDKFRKGAVIAHEIHHLLRKNKALKNVLSKRDSATYHIVDQINNEGIADLIDKELVLNHSKELLLGSLFKEALFDQAESVIPKLDSCFIINSNKAEAFVSKKDFRVITSYLNGHLPGFYMAHVIKRNGKLQELINHSDNPFYIFYLYNEVAKKDKKQPQTYSDSSIEYLRKLEKKAFQ